jgi:hypothetical protein
MSSKVRIGSCACTRTTSRSQRRRLNEADPLIRSALSGEIQGKRQKSQYGCYVKCRYPGLRLTATRC